MSDLLDLQEKLQDTLAALQQARKVLANAPNDVEFSLVVQSLEQRQNTLEATFAAEAARNGIDICKYRLIRSESSYPASAFADSIKTFQSCLTIFFDALRNGPKRAARSPADIVSQTALQIGYVYPGSLGVAFTISNEQALFDTELDEAIKSIFAVMRVSSSGELLDFSRKVGPAPIRKLHEWASTNVKFGMATDIEWRHEQAVKVEAMLQPEEAAQLVSIIEGTKPEVITSHQITGILRGGDLDKKIFHLVVPDADDIEGYMGEEFKWPAGQELPLDHRYTAFLKKHVVVHLSVEVDDVEWELVGLTDPK